MKSKTRQGLLRFPLQLLHYGNSYYIERMVALERALRRRPRRLQIDMLGEGEISADWALLIREILNQRAKGTEVITNARSSLQNGSVLVWLLGDHRMIRPDARIFFRRANCTEPTTTPEKVWNDDQLQYVDSDSEVDTNEADHARVLQQINEFLPVRELVGRIVEVPTLRQFGLIENEKLDALLTSAFRPALETDTAGKREQSPEVVCNKPQATPSNHTQN